MAPISDLAYQNKAVIYDFLFKASAETLVTNRGRPQAPRRSRCCHLRPAHVGLGACPPSARAHDRAWWRRLLGRVAMGVLPAGLLPAGAGTLAVVPPAVFGEAPCRPRRRPSAVLRQSRSARRCTGVRDLSGAAAQGRVGRLLKTPVRRPRGSAGLSLALYPSRRHLQQPLDRIRPARRHLQVE